jgi:hypothetical protein
MKLLIFVLSCAFAAPAMADIFKSTLFSLNTIYLDRDYDDNGAKSKSKETDTDLRLMRIEKYWAYGAIYSLSSNDSSDASRNSYGLTAGYYSEKDFYLNLSYFLSSKYKNNGVEYSKGSGYEFDIGFLQKITSSFYVGLLVALKNFTYTEQTSGSVTSSANATHKEVIPMFTFAVDFM